MDYSWLTGAAAALVLALGPMATSSEASAATGVPGPETTVMSVGAASVTSAAMASNIIAVVPGASIANNDHLSRRLNRHGHYRATFLIWVAPNSRHATVQVRADLGSVRHCSASELKPGTNQYVTCQVQPDPKKGATRMTISVVVHTNNLGQYSRDFRHQISK